MTRARMPRPHEVAAARRDPRLLRAFQERDQDLSWRARGLCRTCDVQGACLAWALDVGDCHGVWGATTPRERRAMLVAWRHNENEPALPVALRDVFSEAAALRTISREPGLELTSA